MRTSPLNVLWIEDSADDIELFGLAFNRAEAQLCLHVKLDGQEGLDHLMRIRHSAGERPQLILLDLNLPKRDGREVLAEIKKNEDLCLIPVIVLTTSNAASDIECAYALGAACYLVKPDGITNLIKLARALSDFWQQVDLAAPLQRP
jgi:two-component system, chemotaxis family, response regulator Rcp1